MNKIVNELLEDWASFQYQSMSDEIVVLINQAQNDLHDGPQIGFEGEDESNYPGFDKACEQIRKELDPKFQDLWVDPIMGEILDQEPEPFYDEGNWNYPTGFVMIPSSQIKKILVGALAEYI